MKNLFLLLVMHILFLPITHSQNVCPNNIFINGDLESGTPTTIHQDIDNANGFSRIWATGSFADYYTATTSPTSFAPPTPATGNYVSCWISNNTSGGILYREGFKAALMHTLPANTGSYTLTFDIACLGGSGNAEIGVYGLHNPLGTIAPTPTAAYTPTNLNLFGAANTVLLSAISVSANSCNNTKTTKTVTINTNAAGYPAAGITHIFISHSDNASINGAIYIAFDNFCLAVASSCPASFLSNGDLESGTTTTNDQDIDQATDFSKIWSTGSFADYYPSTFAPSIYSPPSPATGNYASCWIANNASGGIIYREGFKSKLVAPIPNNTGIYSLKFDMACLGGWGDSEVAVYGINNSSGSFSANPTGPFTPSNIDLFGAANTVLLGTISVNGNNCSSTKTNHTLTFNSTVGFPAQMTHFFITHSDNTGINGSHYVAFDNFCLQSVYSPPCPRISTTEVQCIDDVNGDGIPDYNLQITVNNTGSLTFSTTCGSISPTYLSVPTSGTYNLTLTANGACNPFTFVYNASTSDQKDCFIDEIPLELPTCEPKECLCDKSFSNAVHAGYTIVLHQPNDIFTPTNLTNCDQVEWFLNGSHIGSTMGNASFQNPHIDEEYELCMEVQRTQADGTTCREKFCQIVRGRTSRRSANVGIHPNPANNKVTLKWDTENIPTKLSLRLFNANGIEIQKIHSINGHEGTLDINIQELNNGLYFIQIEGDLYTPTPIKFVKKG